MMTAETMDEHQAMADLEAQFVTDEAARLAADEATALDRADVEDYTGTCRDCGGEGRVTPCTGSVACHEGACSHHLRSWACPSCDATGTEA